MQKILSVKTDNSRNSIPLLGRHLCLVEVTKVSEPGDDIPSVYPLKNAEGAAMSSLWYSFGYYYDNGTEIRLFRDLDAFGELFILSEEDTDILIKFILDTAASLKLTVVQMDIGVVVVNTIINEIAQQGCSVEELENMKIKNKDVLIGSGGAGAATLLGEIVKTGMGRFNKINLTDKVQDIVEIIKTCKFIDSEGNCKPVSVTGVENLLKRVKDELFISPNE